MYRSGKGQRGGEKDNERLEKDMEKGKRTRMRRNGKRRERENDGNELRSIERRREGQRGG